LSPGGPPEGNPFPIVRPVTRSTVPATEAYPQVYKEFQTDEDESMIGYPVEVTLSSRPAVKTVASPIRCWSTF
jgi:hypothetical protein